MSAPPNTPDDAVGLLAVSVDVSAGSVTLAGEFDHCSAHLLTDAGSALAHGRASAWAVDAAGVTFCDAGGITALLALRQQAALRGRTVHLVRASPCVRRLIGLVGLADQLPMGAPAGPVPRPPPWGSRRTPAAGGLAGPLRV